MQPAALHHRPLTRHFLPHRPWVSFTGAMPSVNVNSSCSPVGGARALAVLTLLTVAVGLCPLCS